MGVDRGIARHMHIRSQELLLVDIERDDPLDPTSGMMQFAFCDAKVQCSHACLFFVQELVFGPEHCFHSTFSLGPTDPKGACDRLVHR